MSIPADATIDTTTLNTALQNSWWNWYQGQAAENHSPLSFADAYQISMDTDLHVPATQGVLANDLDPDLDQLQVTLLRGPQHGELELMPDGSFWYLANPGYIGVDEFSYLAADRLSVGQAGQVTVRVLPVVTAAGDFNRDGAFNEGDLSLLRLALTDVYVPQYDLNQDGRLDGNDWQFMVTQVLRAAYGDANFDGCFDSGDLVAIFQVGEYEDTEEGNSDWAEGDWNGDGEFTTADLIAAFQAGDYQNQPKKV